MTGDYGYDVIKLRNHKNELECLTDLIDHQADLIPKDWYINVEPRFFCGKNGDEVLYYATAIKPIGTVLQEGFINLKSDLLPTESLARLHAIIQATLWNNENN